MQFQITGSLLEIRLLFLSKEIYTKRYESPFEAVIYFWRPIDFTENFHFILRDTFYNVFFFLVKRMV